MIYRLYTEDKNRETIKEIVGKYFEGYSLIPCDGVWKGASEKALIVEIVVQPPSSNAVERIAREIKEANRQETVMVVTIEEVDQCFV
jgi:hypothetical protein